MKYVAIFLNLILFYTYSYAQCVKGDCYSGSGTFIFNSGAVYTGQFIKGKIQGKGKCEFTNGNIYFGEWKDQFIDGLGTMKFANGDVYIGQFAKGKLSGVGQMRYINGDFYEGQWSNNKKHGKGNLVQRNGGVISGMWTNGIRLNNENTEELVISAVPTEEIAHSESFRNCNKMYCKTGKGIYTYRDGSVYTGEFKDGFPEGQGVCEYANGDRYQGGWKDHGPNGQGMIHFHSGRVYAAIWENGTPVKELQKEEEPRKNQQKFRSAKAEESPEVNIYAVVIGVANYTHMPRLKYTDDDAYQIYAFLKSPEGGAIPEDQIKVLVDENATKENILSSMENTFWRADENDVIILYFSGHGLEGNFLPFDYDGYNNRLAHNDIMDIIDNSKAKHKVFFADACHSGSLESTKSPLSQSLGSYFKRFEKAEGGTAILASSKGEEVSMEYSGLRQGVFSHYLIRGLKGAADYNDDKIVTITELYDYVYTGVGEYTFNGQHPTISGDYDRDMPVGNRR